MRSTGKRSDTKTQTQFPSRQATGESWQGYAHACSVLSHVHLFATAWTVTHQAPLSMGFPKREYWSGLPFLSPGDLVHLEIKLHP